MEEKKRIIDSSFRYAVKRSLIHILPIFISILLVTLKWKGVHLGQELGNETWHTTYTLAALQIAAKVQELLVSSSLATIVFHILRDQLLNRDGLPLVLVSAGFTFTKLRQWCTRSIFRGTKSLSALLIRLVILACIFSMGLVNLVIGPASAVLILPRLSELPIWAPTFWLNGTSDDLWPTNLTLSHVGDLNTTANSPGSSGCTLPRGVANSLCVSSAYQKLKYVVDSAPDMFHHEWTFISRETNFERQLSLVEGDGSQYPETWVYSPHVATGYIQDQLWWDNTWFQNPKYDYSGRTSTVETKSPAARTTCLWQNITLNTTELEFPALSEFSVYEYDSRATVKVSPSLWTDDNETFVEPRVVRTLWIPQTDAQNIGSVTAGIIVMEHLQNSNATARSSLVCSVDARWVNTNTNQADGGSDIAITAQIDSEAQPSGGLSGYSFLPTSNSWSKITATDDWIQALLPTVPYLEPKLQLSQPASTLANILMSSNHNLIGNTTWPDGYIKRPYIFWEFVISTLFADGIARIGYAQQFNANVYVKGSDNTTTLCKPNPGSGEPAPPAICPGPPPNEVSYTSMSMQGSFQSVYAWRASATTDYLSIAVVLTYVCIALSHIAWTLIRRRSSGAWERLEDLLALAHSSQPDPSVLQNTCAGISLAKTMSQTVRIVATGYAAEGDEQVQMVFTDGDAGQGAVFSGVGVDERYGKVK